MSKNVKVKIDIKGLDELMKSAWMQDELNELASAVCGRADGYNFRTHTASFVAITNIYPETHEAYMDNLANKTLLKILEG